MITSLLIANRGEIACRIIRSCRALGIRAVAVYSDADANARHTKLADEAVRLGPAPVSDSYLLQTAVLEAAHRAGVDAIHPGYGFLAENAQFARACVDAGFVFVGPVPDVIATMGNKQAAKTMVAAAGIPVLSGYGGPDQSVPRLTTEAAAMGYPVLVKAAAGGGGKGMRVVGGAAELPDAIAAAGHEAAQAFGSDQLLLEKWLPQPRHIEVQILADGQGAVLHLGERDCSLQRRYQKVIEETPAPGLSLDLRQTMGETAVAIARMVHYINAGTVEFLLAENGDFYFLEMNTRLQVEHPITELVTGIDLVAWQIRIAAGESLPFKQADIVGQGHAIEARIYAENPALDFLPVTGTVQLWREPTAEGIRVDSGLQTGDEVTIHYDPLLAKISAHGPDRPTAIRRLHRALQETVLLGLTTNLPFLPDILSGTAFATGLYHTEYLQTDMANWEPATGETAVALIAATLAQFKTGPGGYWRNNPNPLPPFQYQLDPDAAPVAVTVQPLPDNEYHIEISDWLTPAYSVRRHSCHVSQSVYELVLIIDGYRQPVTAVLQDDHWYVHTNSGSVTLQALPRWPEPRLTTSAASSLRAPLPGVVTAVLVAPGQKVVAGQPLLKLEAMKMEHTIRAVAAGTVVELYCQPGELVAADAQLVQIIIVP